MPSPPSLNPTHAQPCFPPPLAPLSSPAYWSLFTSAYPHAYPDRFLSYVLRTLGFLNNPQTLLFRHFPPTLPPHPLPQPGAHLPHNPQIHPRQFRKPQPQRKGISLLPLSRTLGDLLTQIRDCKGRGDGLDDPAVDEAVGAVRAGRGGGGVRGGRTARRGGGGWIWG